MKTRILLADDHDLMREGLRAILEKEADFEVVGEAASGREAVRRAAELKPDIVIMDVAMKELNGVEATRRIKEGDDKVRIVALSSHPDRRYVTAILRAGASGYVLKANAYRELRRAIELARVGKSFLSDGVAGAVVEEVRTAAGPRSSVYQLLSGREREVLQLLAEGLTSPEISERLHIARSTVETHRRNLMQKLDLHNTAELVRYAVREGLTSLES